MIRPLARRNLCSVNPARRPNPRRKPSFSGGLARKTLAKLEGFFSGARSARVADSGRANGSRPPSSRKGEALSGIVQIEAPIFSRFAWPGGQSVGGVCLSHKRQVSSPVELAGAAACGTRRSIERRIRRPALPSEERCSKACQAPGLEERRHAFAAGHACSEFAASPSCPSPWQAHAPARTQHRDFAA